MLITSELNNGIHLGEKLEEYNGKRKEIHFVPFLSRF